MSVVAYIFLELSGLLKKRNKIITFLITMIMIAFFAGARDLADTPVYINRYNYVSIYSSFTEWLYTLVSQLFSQAGIDFYIFWTVIAIFCVGVRVYILSKMTPNLNLVLALYCLFPFYLDVCWMRMTLGMTFVYIAFYLWIKHKNASNKIKAILIFSSFIVIAGGFHASLLLYLILIIPEYVSTKKIAIATGIISICGLILTRNNRLYALISRIVSSEKADIILSTSSYGQINTWLLYTVFSVLLLAFFLHFVLCFSKKILLNTAKDLKIGKTNYLVVDYLEYLKKINILLLSIISIIPFSGGFYRLQLYMIPMFLVGYSYCFKEDKGLVIRKNEVNHLTIFLIGIGIIFYFYVYHTSIFDSVYIPFFGSNAWF